MKKKGMFEGFKTVFSFTAEQTVKSKGFKSSTIGIFLFLFILVAAINVIMMFATRDDSSVQHTPEEGVELEEKWDTELTDIYVYGSIDFANKVNGEVSDEVFTIDMDLLGIDDISKELINQQITYTKVIPEIKAHERLTSEDIEARTNEIKEFLSDKEHAAAISLYVSMDGRMHVDYITKDDTDLDVVGSIADSVSEKVYSVLIENYEVTEEQISVISQYNFLSAQTLKAGDETSIGAYLVKMLAPMLVSLIVYMMILMNGQTITKAVMSEKTSKLVETLLTSVKPYAVIAGKVLSMALVAIGQMFIWILGGVLGFVVGDHIAKTIDPNFVNQFGSIVEILRESAGTAFTIEALIMAIVFIMVGFLTYCFAAALAASFIDKPEALSNAIAIFQIPVIIGFLASYLAPIIDNDLLNMVSHYLPIISPFSIPAEVLVGNVNMLESAISLVLLLVTCFVVVIFTGRVYKSRIFSR